MDQRVVAIQRRALQVVKELSAAAGHCNQTAARVEVLLVRSQVVCEVRDSRGENCNLYFAGARIAFGDCEFLDYILLVDGFVFRHLSFLFMCANFRVVRSDYRAPAPCRVRRLNFPFGSFAECGRLFEP